MGKKKLDDTEKAILWTPLLIPKPYTVNIGPMRWVFPLYKKKGAGTVVKYASHNSTSH